jgi:hypothetical protein
MNIDGGKFMKKTEAEVQSSNCVEETEVKGSGDVSCDKAHTVGKWKPGDNVQDTASTSFEDRCLISQVALLSQYSIT